MVDKLYLAKPRGFCAGVVMAIQAVERAAEELHSTEESEMAVFHPIVHNDTVVERLERSHDVRFVETIDEISTLRDQTRRRGGRFSDTVVFSAHGVSPTVRRQADAAGLTTLDATCPLVTKVHSEAKKYAALGYHILLIGDSTRHQEVIGTYGEAPDRTTIVAVINNPNHDPALVPADEVTVPDPDKVVVLTQTTLSVDDTMRTIEVIKQRYPKLVVPSRDDLCYATKNRQDAVREIGCKVDLFLVVTSNYSSNGMRLLELATKLTGNARRIENVNDIQPAWLDGVHSIGVTSAASTPDDLVQDIVKFFEEANPSLEIIEEGEWENITFRQPKPTPPSQSPA